MRRHARSLLVLVLLLGGGCALSEKKNRRTLNLLDAQIQPESTAARIALGPLVFPAGLLATVTDQLIVHPAMVIDDAWQDTEDLLWTSSGETMFKRVLLLPLVTLATPPFFLGDWLARSIFALDNN